MKRPVYLFFTIAALFLSCNSNDRQEATTGIEEAATDSINTARAENTFSNETIDFINETGFSKYARSKSPQLNWDNFKMTRFWKEEFLRKDPFTAPKNYFEIYGRFLKYSPDSSRFIDLDSYNVDIQRDKKGRLVGHEQGPDTEVSLIDLAKKEKMRLLFLGPGNSVEDAGWIDNDNLILMGLQERENGAGINAVVWKFDLASKMVYVYELEDADLVNSMKNYSYKERLKGVTIQ